MFPLARHRQTAVPAATISSVVMTPWDGSAVTQWDDQTTGTINGSGFDVSTSVFVDGGSVSASYVSSSQMTFTLSAAHISGSPLQTSGTKTITATNASGIPSNSKTFSVAVFDWTTPSSKQGIWVPGVSAVTLDGSDGISQIDDISGNARHLAQSDSAKRHNYLATSILNGQPAMRCFANADECLYSAAAMSSFITTSAGTVTCVYASFGISTGATQLKAGPLIWGDANSIIGLGERSTKPQSGVFNDDGAYEELDSVDPAPFGASKYVITFKHTGGNIYQRSGLGTATTAASGNSTSLAGVMNVGGKSTVTGQEFNGWIGPVAAYNAVLSTYDEERLIRKSIATYGCAV